MPHGAEVDDGRDLRDRQGGLSNVRHEADVSGIRCGGNKGLLHLLHLKGTVHGEDLERLHRLRRLQILQGLVKHSDV